MHPSLRNALSRMFIWDLPHFQKTFIKTTGWEDLKARRLPVSCSHISRSHVAAERRGHFQGRSLTFLTVLLRQADAASDDLCVRRPRPPANYQSRLPRFQ